MNFNDRLKSIAILAAAVLAFTTFALHAEPPQSAATAAATAEVDRRTEELLAQLTLDEKLQLLGGVDSFYTRPIDRLNIPRLKMSDGPVGTRNDGPTTAYPAGVALAATWDPALAEREGQSLGRDARARGDHFLLGPGVNIYREPQNGRNFEYFGEDPYLAGQIAVGYIRGVQSQGVAACVKHFACNNQETDRMTIDARVDERALHEIYLPAFEAAVKSGHAWSVMASYNRINGDYATANHYLLTDVLKDSWGFTGVLMSDWGATHDTLGPMTAGMDLEMPSPKFLNAAKIKPLIDDGPVSIAMIDDKVRRLLRVMLAMHWLDRPQKDSSIPLEDPSSNDTALAVARESIVLLKNQGNLLPLDRNKPQTIAVVGPTAAHYTAGGGSSMAKPFHPITVLEGLQKIAGDRVKIVHIPFISLGGNDLTAFADASQYESPGLAAEFFNNRDLTGKPVTRADHTINFNWHDEEMPIDGITTRSFSARWTGNIRAAESGPYVFAVNSDDGSRVKLDGKTIIDDWTNHATRVRTATVNLTAGETHDVVVEYYNSRGGASVQFGWGKPPALLSPDDRNMLAQADAVIACVGTSESEGADRAYELPEDQNQLITDAAGLNPKTIVILNAGGNVAMADWIERVPALLNAWYPGQAGGQAIAETIFGDNNPSGHLPDTFEKQWPDAPASGHYPGKDGKVEYAEGIYVGYRWFDSRKIEPRFPFGHGLSYTTFTIDNLKITPVSGGDSHDQVATVTVTNTGNKRGATVAQLYVRPHTTGIDRPLQELKAFARVELEPGQNKTITLPLNSRSFAYWDVDTHAWKSPAGEYEIAVGTSSRDIACVGRVELK
ncbi:MAG TPA: glycoside hydrolase family 3 C-terminal domain-containing protein [Tepidisphaeraceae bacterium]|nr:glycoside hydrolase family 3 C-terminal domain-containing protein [Tepidisphaeraceae bacterium]